MPEFDLRSTIGNEEKFLHDLLVIIGFRIIRKKYFLGTSCIVIYLACSYILPRNSVSRSKRVNLNIRKFKMAECCNGHCFLIYIHTDWCEVTRKELSWNSLNSWNVCICSATVKITDRSHWWHILIFFQNSRKFWKNVSSSNTWYDVYNRLKSSTTLLGSTIPIIPAPISPSGCSTTSSVIPVIISSSIAILEHKEYKLTFCI